LETVSISNRLRALNFCRRTRKRLVSKGNALGGGSYYKPSVAVLFFEPEVEPSVGGSLLETNAGLEPKDNRLKPIDDNRL
jgi:hypothetical protein